MIHTVGDSHAEFTFRGIPGVTTHHLGPVTMHRLGRRDDHTLNQAVQTFGLAPSDTLIVCCGEIDVRCHIQSQIAEHGRELGAVVFDLIDSYLAKLATLSVRGASVGTLSVTPPVTAEKAWNKDLPVMGSDDERASYAAALNLALAAGCARLGFVYVDTYSYYCNPRGMLIATHSDGCVHLTDPVGVRRLLVKQGLLEVAA